MLLIGVCPRTCVHVHVHVEARGQLLVSSTGCCPPWSTVSLPARSWRPDQGGEGMKKRRSRDTCEKSWVRRAVLTRLEQQPETCTVCNSSPGRRLPVSLGGLRGVAISGCCNAGEGCRNFFFFLLIFAHTGQSFINTYTCTHCQRSHSYQMKALPSF